MPPLFERILEGLILLAAARPAIDSCISLAFWRTFPGFAWRLAGLLAAYAVCVLLIAIWAPLWILRSLAVAAAIAMLFLRWHARVAQGRSRGWPPGSLRLLPLAPWFDRTFFLTQARRVGTPFKTSHFIRPMACLVGLGDGLAFLKANEAALASPPLPFSRFIPGGFLRHMPPARHAATKQILRDAFTADVYEPLDPFVRQTIRTELERAAADSQASAAGIAPRPHIQRLLFAIWSKMFFNVSSADPAFARLKAAYRTIDIRNPRRASDQAVRRALQEIIGIAMLQLSRDAESRAVAPRTFLEALATAHPDSVTDRSVTLNLIYVLHTSWADVSGLLQWLWRMLTEHSGWKERVRHFSGDGKNRDLLARRIVMETLRLEQSEQFYRVATRRIQHAQFVIPEGWLIRLCVRESHQDPSVFDNPGSFDPDRFLRRTYSRREYAPFGGALRHACLGEGLTTMVGRIFVEELAGGFSWQTIADGDYEYSPWRHWRPSSKWRVSLARAND